MTLSEFLDSVTGEFRDKLNVSALETAKIIVFSTSDNHNGKILMLNVATLDIQPDIDQLDPRHFVAGVRG